MKKFASYLILTLGFILACEEHPTTSTLVVFLSGATNQAVGLYDPASVTLNAVNTSDAIYTQSFGSNSKATFSNVLPGNYIVVFHGNVFLRKGVQVKAGETLNVNL